MSRTITIVGGGLAGLTLGIGLRQRGVPVTIWEAGDYPRHRVCGEFISGGGQDTLARLGLLPGLQTAGAREARSAAFFAGNGRVAARPLPTSACCISRFVLDAWLAREFERLGGTLQSGVRWTGGFAEGMVRAGGRRAEPVTNGWRYFGLKAHARGVPVADDLEVHFVPSGYVGLCRLPGGEVNICGLFRSRTTVPQLARHWRDWLGGPARSVLHARLAAAQFDEESLCSVAGLSLRTERATSRQECCVGDALTMIPPVTGNGMSMAFESAELAIDPVGNFSRGRLTWPEARREVASSCDHRFRSRLRWATGLQWALFQTIPRSLLVFLVARSGWLWRALFESTR